MLDKNILEKEIRKRIDEFTYINIWKINNS